MSLMGLDISLTSTGYSIDGSTGLIKVNSRGAQRLHEISQAVLNMCSEYSIDTVILEGYSFASRNSQAHSIGELGGCIRMRLWENTIPYVEVPPTSRAKFATGKGNAGKTEVISSISSKTGMVFSGSGADDECDAWVLEQMGLAQLGKSKYQWTKEQLSALEKIDWSQMNGVINAQK
jgi:crossover junction endodeoxyribonuclease RuvC